MSHPIQPRVRASDYTLRAADVSHPDIAPLLLTAAVELRKLQEASDRVKALCIVLAARIRLGDSGGAMTIIDHIPESVSLKALASNKTPIARYS